MRRPLCCICVAFVATVFLYLSLNPLPQAEYPWEDGSRVTLLGEVYQKEYKEEQLILYLKHIKLQNEPQNLGKAICYIKDFDAMQEPKMGSTVVVEGAVSFFDETRNPGEFDIKKYYQILGVDFRIYKAQICALSSNYSIYHETLCQIRCHFEYIFDIVLSPKDASIMKAMVLGNKTELDAASKQLFQRSGIAHIFAISGLHITLLGMGLFKILRKTWLPQMFCTVISIGVMIAYGDMAGMSSSAHRAVVMFGMQLAARNFKRTYDMLTALAVAAVLVLVEQPLYLYHSGFLLSFGAILGLGCMTEIFLPEQLDRKKGITNKMVSSLCASLGIFLIHFPIMLCTYYTFPIYSFMLNLVIIPAMTIVMLSGILCLGFGSIPFMFGLGVAKLAGGVCHLLLLVFELLCTLSLKLPFADWIVGRPANWKICLFAVSVLYLYMMHHYGKHCSKMEKCAGRGMIIGLPHSLKAMIVLTAVAMVSSCQIDGTTLAFIDVGQGDCVWIESEKGEHFLIDGGSTSKSKIGEYTIVPYLKYMGISKVDAVFLTHLDSDHISGILEMLDSSIGVGEGIAIGRICISDAVIEDEVYEKLVSMCRRKEVPLYRLKTGDRIKAYGLEFEVLHPVDKYEALSRNAYSLVLKMTVRDKQNQSVTALFTGDVEADGEQAAARVLAAASHFEEIDIYKAAHHGSKYSNTAELIAMANPRLAVISCGEDNRYGHPHTEAIENFKNVGSEILITKDTGAITIKIKSGNCKVDKWR